MRGAARLRGRSERGAALVELAMVVPILLLLSLGTFDLGMAWRTDIAVSNAARAAARVPASLGAADTADFAGLVALGTALGPQITGEVERVVIFKANGSTGKVPSTCLTASALTSGGNSAGVCNVYSKGELQYALDHPNSPPTGYTGVCPGSRRDRFWCAPGRAHTQVLGGTGLDYVGVHVVLQHTTATRMFAQHFTLADTAVMRIEPGAGNT